MFRVLTVNVFAASNGNIATCIKFEWKSTIATVELKRKNFGSVKGETDDILL